MQFAVRFDFAVYYNKTDAKRVLPTLLTALFHFLLVGSVSQSGQVMRQFNFTYKMCNNTFNLLNAQLNPICHLLALLGAHHILHISRIRVKAIRFQVVQSHAPQLDGSFCPQLKLRTFSFFFLFNFNEM
jgi:hypothetical protein